MGAIDTPTTAPTAGSYPSFDMSMRIWAHDRAPTLEVEEEWYGYKLRRHPHDAERQHARARHGLGDPLHAMVANIPYVNGGGLCVPRDD